MSRDLSVKHLMMEKSILALNLVPSLVELHLRPPIFRTSQDPGITALPSMRTLFKPSPGNVIVQADYSQAELRSIAVFSGDPDLTAIYMDSTRSLHKERAIAFYGENYTKDEYVQAKNMNFGITYGQGANAFSWHVWCSLRCCTGVY
jgi:hypothetical protein